ncbi:MAG: pyrroloquinoline quinone biosynthesis peptide chaperone PqqD [Dongiaceae bacterium]
MIARLEIGEASVPRLARHVRLRFDQPRDQWVLLAPERLFVLDPIALAVIERCKGERSVAAIVDDLAATYDAPRPQVLQDVQALLQGLADKGVVTAS